MTTKEMVINTFYDFIRDELSDRDYIKIIDDSINELDEGNLEVSIFFKYPNSQDIHCDTYYLGKFDFMEEVLDRHNEVVLETIKEQHIDKGCCDGNGNKNFNIDSSDEENSDSDSFDDSYECYHFDIHKIEWDVFIHYKFEFNDTIYYVHNTSL